MKRFLSPLFAAGCLLASLSAASVPKSLPAQSRFVACARLAELRTQPFVTKLLDMFKFERDMALGQLMMMSGLDWNTVDNVWLAVEKKDYGVVVLQGKFNAAAIEAAVSKNSMVHRETLTGADLAVSFKPGDVAALVGDSVIVMGKTTLVQTFLENYKGEGAGLDGDKWAKVNAMADAKAAIHAVLFEVYAGDTNHAPWLRNLLNGEISAEVQDNIGLNLMLGFASAEQAAALEQTVNGWINLVKTFASPATGEALKKLVLDSIAVSHDGAGFTLNAALPGDELLKLIAERKNGKG